MPWTAGAPVRHAGGILPEGVEQVYFIVLIAPRGPPIHIYGMQAKPTARTITLAEQGVRVTEQFEKFQPAEHRVDIVRDVWLDQLADTERRSAYSRRSATPSQRARESSR